MITLTNDFHNSSVNVRAQLGTDLSERQVRRIRRVLCGIEDCTCSARTGVRGEQQYWIDDIYYTVRNWSD